MMATALRQRERARLTKVFRLARLTLRRPVRAVAVANALLPADLCVVICTKPGLMPGFLYHATCLLLHSGE